MTTVTTAVDVDEYEKLLTETNYCLTETKFLVDSFRHDFDLGYRGPIEGVRCNAWNLKLRDGTQIDLWNKVMKEVKLGRYAGPFSDPPFKNYIQSPIGLVPKDGGRDT